MFNVNGVYFIRLHFESQGTDFIIDFHGYSATNDSTILKHINICYCNDVISITVTYSIQ